jgi:ankyrin repeat protein
MRYQYGGANPEKIFEKYKEKLINRLRTDTTAEIDIDNLTTLPREIIAADPTGNKQYIEWITNSYILGGISLYEDLSRTHMALDKYDKLRNSGKLEKNPDVKKDENIISNFCGLQGCEKKNKKLVGLDDLIDKYKDEFEKKELKEEGKSKAQKEGITVYESETIRVIQPTTTASACYYGRGTRWCTAATEGENMFEKYNKHGRLYIIIPKNPSRAGEKYQIHFETYQFMDEKDTPIKPEKLVESYPELSKFHLIFATMKGSVEDVKNALPSTNERHINMAFLIASKKGNLEIVRLLLENGADVHVENDDALRLASQEGHLEMVRLLLEKGVNVNAKYGHALRAASAAGHLEIVKLLIENGAKVNAKEDEALREASRSGHFKIVKLLIENGAKVNAFDDVALRVASKKGYLEIAQLLLENGADVNANGGQALSDASENGYLEIVRLLIEKGANVNANDNEALLRASGNEHWEIVRLLLENGANVNAHNNYAMRIASAEGYLEIVKFLAKKGANVNNSSITAAIRNGHFEIVKFLLENRANIYVKNDGALIEAAIYYNRPKIVQLLIDYGADFSKVPKNLTHYEKYAEIYNKEYFKRGEKEGDLTDWEDICRYLNQEYRLPQLKSIANLLNIKHDSKITKKELCQLISLDYDAWIKEENKDEKNPRVEIHKKKSIK